MKKIIYAAVMMMGAMSVQVNARQVQVSSESEFNSVIQQNPIVAVMIGSGSCPHCVKMKPIFRALANEMSNVVFVYVEAFSKNLTRLVDKLQVRGIPQFKVYKNGQITASSGGEQSKSKLRALIK